MPLDSDAAASRLLTLARDLRRRKARERNSLFVAEGARTAEELVRAGIPVRGALFTDASASPDRRAPIIDALRQRGVPMATVSEKDFRSASDTENPQGILIVAEVPERDVATLAPADLTRVLVLDAIQDPGNVGTLIRTAAALGVRSVVALKGTADPWNAKVVRSAAGGHFHVIVTSADLDALTAVLRAAAVPLWGADVAGTPVGSASAPERLALAVGNEGAGLTPAVRAAADALVALPMAAGVESLNVGVAAGILLFALGR